MVEKTEMRPVKVRYCDYCGKETSGVYTKCDKCNKDICKDHWGFTADEEECLCKNCRDERDKKIRSL